MGLLDGELLTVAFCWRLERRDGVTVGLTSHDRDLTLDGVVHRATPGMTPSAVRRGDGLDPDSSDVSGALDTAAITEADLTAGRWDGARAVLFAVDWSGGSERLVLSEGTIGAVETADGGFTAELRGSTALLDRAVVEETSAECRAELGDRRCRVAMAGRRRFGRIVAADGRVVTVGAGDGPPVDEGWTNDAWPNDVWRGGLVRWFGGANAGLESAVARSEGDTLTLRTAPPFAVAAGVLVELVEGCDKSLATCAGRFGNAVNFRGEPYLPGIDLLTRYPGA